MIDTRLEGRDQPTGSIGMTLFEAEIHNPERQMISQTQRGWFYDTLSQSKGQGTRWRIIAQQVMMAPLNLAGLPSIEQLLGIDLPDLPLLLLSGPATAINPDQWDGYPAERQRFYDHLRGNGIDNVVVLTGDIHTSWASDLSPDPYNPIIDPVAVEMVCSSVTSGGFESILGSVETARFAENPIRLVNPHIKWNDLTRRGYLLLDVTPERVHGEWYLFESVRTRNLDQQLRAAWQSVNGANRLSSASGPVPSGQAAPATPSTEPVAGPLPTDPEVLSAVEVLPTLPRTGGGNVLLPGAALIGAAGLAEVLRRRSIAEASPTEE